VSFGNSEARAADLAAVGPHRAGAVLAWYRSPGASIGFDEAATVTIAAQHGSALGSAIAHDGGNMSGYTCCARPDGRVRQTASC